MLAPLLKTGTVRKVSLRLVSLRSFISPRQLGVTKDLDLQLTKSLNQLVRPNCSVFKAKNKSAWKKRAIRQRRSQRRSWRRRQRRPPAWTLLARLPDTQFQTGNKETADQIARICHRSQLPSCKLFPLSTLQMVKLFCLLEDFIVNGPKTIFLPNVDQL